MANFWQYTIFPLFAALLIFPLVPGFQTFSTIERALVHFTERRTLAIWVLFFSVIVVRLLLLTTLPVPVPGVHDEFSYLLMGDTFAHGRLTNSSHPMWVSFETFHVNWLPTYCSKYPPAQGLVLAIGQWLGHPWIGVLLSNAAMCALILWMLQAWLPPRWAFLGGCVAAVQFSFATYWMNSYWGGAVAASGGALVLGAVVRILRRARERDAVLLGLGAAILANSRPLEGFILCLPVFGYLALWLVGKTKARVTSAVRWRNVFFPLIACGILTAGFMGYYNWRLTGNPLLMPHVLYSKKYDTAKTFIWQRPNPPIQYRNAQFDEFYNKRGLDYYHYTWTSLKDISQRKIELFGNFFFWKGELLLVPLLPFLARDRKMRLLLLAVFVGAPSLFLVVWYHEHYAAPFVCILTALVVQSMRHLNTVVWRRWRVGSMAVRIIVAMLLAQVGVRALTGRCDPFTYHCEGELKRQAIEKKLQTMPGKHLIMVRYRDHSPHNEWVYNGAEIDDAKILWARELDAEQNAKLFAYFRDRQIWVIAPDDHFSKLAPYSAQ